MIEVQYKYLPLPDRYLAECPSAEWSGVTFADVAALAEARRVNLVNCNAQLSEARSYQARQKAEFAKK